MPLYSLPEAFVKDIIARVDDSLRAMEEVAVPIRKKLDDIKKDLDDIDEKIANAQLIRDNLTNPINLSNYASAPDLVPEHTIRSDSPSSSYVSKRPRVGPSKQDINFFRKEDILIEKFECRNDSQTFYENVFIVELPDGRIKVTYADSSYYTTKDHVMKLPYPPPGNYYTIKYGWNSSNEQAIKKLRKYFAEKKEKEETEDPDRVFKPMLKIDTSTNYDGNKIGDES